MLIYTSNTHKSGAQCAQSEGHANSAISPVFALYYLRSQCHPEVSIYHFVSLIAEYLLVMLLILSIALIMSITIFRGG